MSKQFIWIYSIDDGVICAIKARTEEEAYNKYFELDDRISIRGLKESGTMEKVQFIK